METNRLRQLCTVVETGSVREAARLLHISHGGLSKSLQVLEDELGTALFAASGRGIVVTDAGRRVYASAKRVLAEAEELQRAAKDKTAEARSVRIATFELFSTYFMGELVERGLRPGRLYVREAIPGEIEEAIVTEQVDVGLTYVPMPRGELDHLPVTTFVMGVYGRNERFASVPLADLPFCAPAITLRGSALAVRGLDGFPDERCPRKIVYAVDMMETALDLCRRGLGVAYLPSFVVTLHNRVVEPRFALEKLDLGSEATAACEQRRDVYVVKRKSSPEDAVLRRIARTLRAICPGP